MVDITTDSFSGQLWDPERIWPIIVSAISTDPWLGGLTVRPVGRSEVAFPHSAPSGFDWVAQLQQIPSIDPGSTAPIVSPARLAGNLLLSNEAVEDTDEPLLPQLELALRRGLVRKASRDTLYAPTVANAAAPTPVFASLTASTGTTLRAAVIAAVGDIIASGGSPTTVVLSTALWAAEASREGTAGPVSNAVGMFADLGLETRISASLAAGDGVVLDKSSCFTLVRKDVQAESSRYTPQAWAKDGVEVRIIARLAVAIPVPAESARALDVTP